MVQPFSERGLRFSKRVYGGTWDGKLVWGRLTHSRVLSTLKNPSYVGMYVYGRYQYRRKITAEREIEKRVQAVAHARVDDPFVGASRGIHHVGRVLEDLKNRERLENNRTNGEATVLSGRARGVGLIAGAAVVRSLWASHYRALPGQRWHLSYL